jgi:hypothetical protein
MTLSKDSRQAMRVKVQARTYCACARPDVTTLLNELDALDGLQTAYEEMALRAKDLASRALVALAGSGLCTPLEGFLKAPHCLPACIEELRRQRDEARQVLERIAACDFLHPEDAKRWAREALGKRCSNA